MAAPCSSCGAQITRFTYKGLRYCSTRCMHAAGNRLSWVCSEIDDCGCTQYAKLRRILRETRGTMRDMLAFMMSQRGLEGVPLPLDDGPGGADESSDVEDETLTLRAIVAARSEADALHQLVNSAASLAERERLHAEVARVQAESAREIARLQAELDALRQI